MPNLPLAADLARHSAVLFVNIGWSEDYCRSLKEESRPVGAHQYLHSPVSEEEGASEDDLFVRRADGYFYGGMGGGRVAASQGDLDVVFVARRPEDGCHYIAGIFFGVGWEEVPNTHNHWHDCMTRHALRLFPETRPVIEWPGRQSMRRWARAGEVQPSGQVWPELHRQYDLLCRQYGI